MNFQLITQIKLIYLLYRIRRRTFLQLAKKKNDLGEYEVRWSSTNSSVEWKTFKIEQLIRIIEIDLNYSYQALRKLIFRQIVN